MSIGYETYKGNPLIVLGAESKWPFKFGPAKARMIVENFEAIKKFAEATQDARKSGNKPARDNGAHDRNARLIDSGYQAHAREEGHFDQGDF